MMDEHTKIDILKSENFSEASGLSRENKNMVNRMFKYIQKFPLGEYEVEQMHKDIIGMAAEAEQRNELFTSVIGSNWRAFCDELIGAISDYSIPKGWKYLRIAGIYYSISGWFLLVGVTGSAMTFFPMLFTKQLGTGMEMLVTLISLGIDALSAWLMITAGNKAKSFCADSSKAATCEKWGYIMLLLQIFQIIAEVILSPVQKLATVFLFHFPENSWDGLLWGALAFELFFIWCYIIGAKRNKEKRLNHKFCGITDS